MSNSGGYEDTKGFGLLCYKAWCGGGLLLLVLTPSRCLQGLSISMFVAHSGSSWQATLLSQCFG